MINHAADLTTLNKIASSAWDYVTLQGQSQETSLGAAFLHADVHPFAKALCDSIRSAQPCAEPLFYMTWGRENGDASNCSTSPWVCTYERMDSAIHYSYQELTDSNRCSLAPVGHVWRQFRRKWPGIGLYTSDGSHPNARGSYVAACTFYTLIFKKDPTAISFNHNLSPQIADSIRMRPFNIRSMVCRFNSQQTNRPKTACSGILAMGPRPLAVSPRTATRIQAATPCGSGPTIVRTQ